MNITSTKMANKKAKDYAFVALMLLIPVIHFIIFWGVVNFNSILLAFQRLDRATGEKYLTFKNFESLVELFKTNELKDALVNFGVMRVAPALPVTMPVKKHFLFLG